MKNPPSQGDILEKEKPGAVPDRNRERLEKEISKDKEVREIRSDKEIDKQIEDTFPASDPPSNY